YVRRGGEDPRFFVRDVDSHDNVSGRVIRAREPALLNADDGEPLLDAHTELIGLDVHNVMAVPLLDDDRTIGALTVVNHREPARGFTRDELKVLNLIASRLSGAIVARRHHAEMEKANRLASIGQMLSSVVHDLKNPIAIINGYVQ